MALSENTVPTGRAKGVLSTEGVKSQKLNPANGLRNMYGLLETPTILMLLIPGATKRDCWRTLQLTITLDTRGKRADCVIVGYPYNPGVECAILVEKHMLPRTGKSIRARMLRVLLTKNFSVRGGRVNLNLPLFLIP